MNYCKNVTCENQGVCRSLLGDYRCECLGDSYSGRHCQFVSIRTVVFQIVSKSLGYIAILSLTIVVVFVVTMDLLKYGFGIDPVRVEREQLRREKQPRKRHVPVIQRFIYVNRPPTPVTSTEPMTAMQETAV